MQNLENLLNTKNDLDNLDKIQKLASEYNIQNNKYNEIINRKKDKIISIRKIREQIEIEGDYLPTEEESRRVLRDIEEEKIVVKEEKLFKENNLFNQTQDINMSDNDLNKTKDIVVLNRTVSLSSVASSITNDNEKLLNRTRDITEEEEQKKSKKRLSILNRPHISQESVKISSTSSTLISSM